eukprot:GHVL01043502.1.p1 GENE.GHVL01043502.1~~GHVL01043502.1.p1  ORF type:complete len:106 (-),score=3.27 GHVL01043502.1:110-427(-)
MIQDTFSLFQVNLNLKFGIYKKKGYNVKFHKTLADTSSGFLKCFNGIISLQRILMFALLHNMSVQRIDMVFCNARTNLFVFVKYAILIRCFNFSEKTQSNVAEEL